MRFSTPITIFLLSFLLVLACVQSFVAQTTQRKRSFAQSSVFTPHKMASSASTSKGASSALTDDDALLDQILQVAIDASKKAGDIILGNAGGADVTKCKANSRDLLTLIDPLCEKVRETCAYF